MAVNMLCCGVIRAQIAPGPLSRAHAQLEGITKCGSCHNFGERGFNCLECHREIQRRVDAKEGFHSRAYRNYVGEIDCAHCHIEHRGQKFPLITMDRKSFDHSSQTGFTLEGKHRRQACEKCHNESRIAAAARAEIKLKDLNTSFLGLRRECVSCHEEPHRSQLGLDCLRCHSQEAWKPAPGFSHARASYPLTGQHQQVACEKCHDRSGEGRGGAAPVAVAGTDGKAPLKLLLYKGRPFEGCESCHTDPHHGAFQEVKLSGKCDGCHNTGGWKNDRPARDFNHDVTKFRLVGRHAEQTCGKCHKESDFRRPIAHGLCQNCHQDIHKGQFASRAAGSDCSACHGTTSFKPPLFDRETHRSSTFPLVGRHAALRCAECHQPAGPETRYKTGKLICAACHAEPHGEEFAAEPYGNKCDLCHTEKGFETTTFSIQRHAQTQFPLTGRHTDVECNKCHKPLAPVISKTGPQIPETSAATPDLAAEKVRAAQNARRQYRFAARNCYACHTDPHKIDPQAKLPCETCHITQQWKAVSPFDHSRTRFKLDGSHLDGTRQPLGCAKCHKASGQPGGADRITPLFSGTPAQCSGCHNEKDAHAGQFSRPSSLEEDCSCCHIPVRWNSPYFDHDRARFTLSAVHRKLECSKCHKDQKQVNGKAVRMYRGTPIDCIKCH